MKTFITENGITYKLGADNRYYPQFELPIENKLIGKYGMLCRNYLKQHRRPFYDTLLMKGELNDYLADIDEQARELKHNLHLKYSAVYGITEQQKAENQMEWVQLMNTIAHQIEEIVLSEVVYKNIQA